MPRLLKNIEGRVCDKFEGNVRVGGIIGVVGKEGYIEIFGLTAYLQNFSRVNEFEGYLTNELYGLKTDKDIIELNISY